MKVWLLVACCWSIASGKIVLDRYSYNFNSQAVNMTFKMNSTNQSNTDFSYDIDVYHKVDLITENSKKPNRKLKMKILTQSNQVIVSLMAPQQKDSNDFDKSISKTTLNICSLTETISSNMWMKSIFKPVMGCMSFKAKCPALKVRKDVNRSKSFA